MPFSSRIGLTVSDTIQNNKTLPKKYEKVAEDFIWLKDHPDRTSDYRFGGRAVVLSDDLPAEVRAENSQRTDIWLENLTRIPTIIRMKYDIYKLEKQFKNGEITAEQFNSKADSLGLPLSKGPSSMEKRSKTKRIFTTENSVLKANNTDVKSASPLFEGKVSNEELEKIDRDLKLTNKALNTPIQSGKPVYY